MSNLAVEQLLTEQHYRNDLHASVLADIYQPHLNMVVWQHLLSVDIQQDIHSLLRYEDAFNYRIVLEPKTVEDWLEKQWESGEANYLIQDIHALSIMFADLFDLEKIGLRLELVNKTVSPFFHIDKVVSRLVTTYNGPATEWITESNSDRVALKNRHQDKIMRRKAELNQANAGDVMLFKGDSWENREVEPIVHRSPACPEGQRRLFLTIDML